MTVFPRADRGAPVTSLPGVVQARATIAAVVLRRFLAIPVAVAVLVVGASLPAAAAAPNSLRLKATYDVTATLKWAAGTLDVSSVATVTNDTDEPVDALTFGLLPAKIGQLVLKQVLVGDTPATTSFSDHAVVVTLPAPLVPGERVPVRIDYSSKFRTNATDKNWLFAKINGIVTAYRWIPWLSRGLTYARPNFGEPFVTANTAEVKVRLTTDRTLVVASSGRRTAVSGLTQTFVANDVRDFNFSASPTYRKTSSLQGTTKVVVYYRTLSPTTLMAAAKRALKAFKAKVGSYPWPTFVVAESHLGLGMESPAMVWIPANTPSSNLSYLVTHEAAHQWFYASVGSNQADEPFADEALAEFLTRDLLSSTRASRCTTKTLDRSVYEYSAGCYYEVVYIQGFNYIKAYRQRVGETAFWNGMRAYYAEYRNRIGGTRQFLEFLDAAAPPELAGGHATRFPRLFPT